MHFKKIFLSRNNYTQCEIDDNCRTFCKKVNFSEKSLLCKSEEWVLIFLLSVTVDNYKDIKHLNLSKQNLGVKNKWYKHVDKTNLKLVLKQKKMNK